MNFVSSQRGEGEEGDSGDGDDSDADGVGCENVCVCVCVCVQHIKQKAFTIHCKSVNFQCLYTHTHTFTGRTMMQRSIASWSSVNRGSLTKAERKLALGNSATLLFKKIKLSFQFPKSKVSKQQRTCQLTIPQSLSMN